MSPANFTPPGAEGSPTQPPVLPAAQYETEWIGYEAALPWIDVLPPPAPLPVPQR